MTEKLFLGLILQINRCRRNFFSFYIIIFYCHLVLRKGSRLIRTNDGYASQTFYSLELTDNGMFLCHLLGSKGQHDRNDRAQRLRNSGYSQSYGKKESVCYPLSPEYADSKKNSTEHQDQD